MRNPFTNYSNFTASKVALKFQSESNKERTLSSHSYSSSMSSYRPMSLVADEYLEQQRKGRYRAQMQLELYGIETLRYKPIYLDREKQNSITKNEYYKSKQEQDKQKISYQIYTVKPNQQKNNQIQLPYDTSVASRQKLSSELRKSTMSDLIAIGQQTRCRSGTKESIINKIDPYSSIAPYHGKSPLNNRNSRDFMDPYSSNNWNMIRNTLKCKEEPKVDFEIQNKNECIMESEIYLGSRMNIPNTNAISAKPELEDQLSSCEEADIQSDFPSRSGKSASTLKSFAFVSEYKLKKPKKTVTLSPITIFVRKKKTQYFLVENQGQYI